MNREALASLADVLETVRTTRSRNAKETALAAYLASLDDATLPHAARMLSGRVFPVDDRRSPRAGGKVWRAATSAATGWDPATVGDAMRAAGDAGEAIALLLDADPTTRTRTGPSVLELVALAEKLAATGSPARKVAILAQALGAMPPRAAKYAVKLLSGGLRVGAQQGIVEAAIARASEAKTERVRTALSRSADIGDVALKARRGELDTAEARVGRPIGFMLATPIQSVANAPGSDGSHEAWVAEDKLDGIRAQVHKQGGEVRLFARSGDPLDGMFPELEDALRWGTGAFVLDGEIVALHEDGSIAPFALLQERLNRTRVGTRETRRVPVALVVFDALVADPDGSLLERPWTARRARLEAIVHERAGAGDRVRLLASRPLEGRDLEDLRREALERGAEGLVLKRIDAVYDAGRRGQAWIKVKKEYATLDVVVTAAEEGHGKRRGMLSDYTFAVRSGDELLNVGKAYSGLTDEEIEALTTRLTKLTTARYGRVRSVKPEVVLEVAFDGINRSKRHRSGYALRFPRIARLRDDRSPRDASTLDEVRALFEQQGVSRARRDA